MPKKIFFTLLATIYFTVGQAQTVSIQVINAAGQQRAYLNTTHEWSVGELAVVESMIVSGNSLTNGFLQPFKVLDYLTLTGFNIKPTNIITLDGDGENDAWIIENIEEYPDNEVLIYDRAGKLIFREKNYSNSFKGHYNNEPLKQDTYFYVIKINNGSKSGMIKGFITVIVK